jgi:hypothetical protein
MNEIIRRQKVLVKEETVTHIIHSSLPFTKHNGSFILNRQPLLFRARLIHSTGGMVMTSLHMILCADALLT